MATKTNKFLNNQTLDVAVRVTNRRLQRAGVIIDKDLGVTEKRKPTRMINIPDSVMRRLAGG